MRKNTITDDMINRLTPIIIEHGNKDKFEDAVKAHHQFKVRLPLIGSFSVGKSSLINRLLGEKLLSVEINPETCLPVEITYDENEKIELISNKGHIRTLNREQLITQNFGQMDPQQQYWVELHEPCPQLQSFSDLVIVDMPGWESGVNQHSQAIDNYIHFSGAYMIVVSSEDGEIKESIKRILLELKIHQKPVVLVITKAAKRLPEDLPKIKEKMIQSIHTILGEPPIYTAITDSRKGNISEFIQAINLIYQKTDMVYFNMVGQSFINVLEDALKRLDILLNSDNLTLEEVKAKYELVSKEINDIKGQLTITHQQIDNVTLTCISKIKDNLRNQLNAEMLSMTTTLLDGGDISDTIGYALRQAFTDGVENDFKPKISHKLESLSEELFPEIGHIDTNGIKLDCDSVNESVFGSTIAVILGQIVSLIPILKPFTVIITGIFSLFSSKTDADRAEQKSKNRDKVRRYLTDEVIPDVLKNSASVIKDSMKMLSDKIKRDFENEINHQAQIKMKALTDLQIELNKNENEHQEQIAKYNQQKEMLLTTLTMIKNKG